MLVSNLKTMIETAEALGHKNMKLYMIEQGRDGGKVRHLPARAIFFTAASGDQREPDTTILTIVRDRADGSPAIVEK